MVKKEKITKTEKNVPITSNEEKAKNICVKPLSKTVENLQPKTNFASGVKLIKKIQTAEGWKREQTKMTQTKKR